jgi:hypothetical protein
MDMERAMNKSPRQLMLTEGWGLTMSSLINVDRRDSKMSLALTFGPGVATQSKIMHFFGFR